MWNQNDYIRRVAQSKRVIQMNAHGLTDFPTLLIVSQ